MFNWVHAACKAKHMSSVQRLGKETRQQHLCSSSMLTSLHIYCFGNPYNPHWIVNQIYLGIIDWRSERGSILPTATFMVRFE